MGDSYEMEKYTSEQKRFFIGSFVLFYTKANNDARPEKDNRLRTAPIIKASSTSSNRLSLPHFSYTFIFFIYKVGRNEKKETQFLNLVCTEIGKRWGVQVSERRNPCGRDCLRSIYAFATMYLYLLFPFYTLFLHLLLFFYYTLFLLGLFSLTRYS